MTSRRTLMIPGPTQSPDYVLQEMAGPVLPHYESEWSEVYWQIDGMLQQVFGTTSDVISLNGSGTLSFEIALASLIRPGDRVLAIDNSFYGDAMGRAALGFGADVTFMNAPQCLAVTEESLRRHLERGPYALVATAHHDTATGFLNPLETTGALCREYNVPLLVDCVSSIGAMPFLMDDWGVDFACGSVQKALDCPAGLALVGVSERGWDRIREAGDLKRGRYMSLANWRRARTEMRMTHPNLISIATNNMMGLRASLERILEEGLERRLQRLQRYGTMLRRGLQAMGLETFVPDEHAPILTRVVFPEGLDRDEAREFLRFNYNILVGSEFRVAHFGAGVNEDTITLVLVALEDYLRSKGVRPSRGAPLSGLEEFRRVDFTPVESYHHDRS